MTKPEIEKLADEYVVSNMKSFMEENLTYTDAFKAGYLKGVEAERKRCLEIANKTIERYSDPKEGKGALFYMTSTKELIERGNDE